MPLRFTATPKSPGENAGPAKVTVEALQVHFADPAWSPEAARAAVSEALALVVSAAPAESGAEATPAQLIAEAIRERLRTEGFGS